MIQKIFGYCKTDNIDNLRNTLNVENYGYDLNKLTRYNKTLLYCCIKSDSFKCAKYLLKTGDIDPNTKSVVNGTPEHPITTTFKHFKRQNLRFITLLLKHIDVKYITKDIVLDSIKHDTSGSLLEFLLSKMSFCDLRRYESTIMIISTISHIKVFRRFENVCIDLLELARFALYEKKFLCFEFLMSHLKFRELINHYFRITIGHNTKTDTLLSLCSSLYREAYLI